MRIEQLRQIIEIEKCKSVSKAAKELYMTQPSLSVSLNNLEEELAIKLFTRKNTGVVATSEGEEVLHLAKNIINNLEKIKKVGKGDALSGDIKVGVPPAFFNAFSAELTMKFRNQCPQAHLILQEVAPKVVRLHLGKAYNIGIGSINSRNKDKLMSMFEDSTFNCEIIEQSQLKLFVGTSHPLAQKESVTMEDIKNYPFIQFDSMLDVLPEAKLRSEYDVVTVYDREVMKQIIVQGNGVNILPEIFGYQDFYIQQELMKMVNIDDLEYLGLTYLLYPRKEYITKLEETTVELIRATISMMKEMS